MRPFLHDGEGEDECESTVHSQFHRMMVLDREEVRESSPLCWPALSGLCWPGAMVGFGGDPL